ncbi:unnamed protein product, partial [Meganyctiphanes norvegica]
ALFAERTYQHSSCVVDVEFFKMFLWNVLILFLFGLKSLVHCRGHKYGAFIGRLPNLSSHNVSGTVYAPSEDQIFIKGLYYDGLGPATHFLIGTQGSEPDGNGIILRYPRSNTNNNDDHLVLPKFVDEDVLLDLPEGTTITQFKWFSIWCSEFTVSFGHVFIPKDLEVPQKSGCPSGFFRSGGSTHCFKYFNDRKRNWDAAKTKCEQEGLIIAQPYDIDVISLRQDLINQYGDANVWLGARGDGYNMVWQSGKILSSSSGLWYNGSNQGGVSKRNCLGMAHWPHALRSQPRQVYNSWECQESTRTTLCQAY